MSIVTKTGDSGDTGLFGGRRVRKDHPRVEACGTVDELNAALSIALCYLVPKSSLQGTIKHLQHLLFHVGADLATPLEAPAKVTRMTPQHIAHLEEQVSALESILPKQTAFILPGGTLAAAHLHLARTICRRAERRVITLEAHESINSNARIFLNRLSDYLFIAARKANEEQGQTDVEVHYEQ